MELVSIIIPIYNTDKFLDACITSAVNQSYKNLEIILVNDGSTDKSGEICNAWCEKDRRVKVIHKENGGLSDARNVGLNSCTGDCFCFLDSDDLLHLKYVEILLMGLMNSDCLYAECNYKNFYDENSISKDEINEAFIKAHYGNHLLENKTQGCFNESFCTKMFKKEIKNKICFPIGKIYEDSYINYKLFYELKSIIHVNSDLYFYRVGNESISKGKFHKRFLYLNNVLQEREEFFKERKEADLLMHTYGLIAAHNLYLYYKAKRDKADKSVIKEIKVLAKTYSRLCRGSKFISANLKKLLSIFKVCPQLFYLAYRMREKLIKKVDI